MKTQSHFTGMKPLRFGVILLALAGTAAAQDSAYKALRLLASERGRPLLNKVIEVVGSHGTPQPVKWKVTVDDPLARGGVREFEISGGKIVSERAPVRLYVGAGAPELIDFSRLNLDSTGAFDLANKEAVREQAGFDSVDYALRPDEDTGTPTWALHLVSSSGREVTLFIAADTGRIVRTTGMRGGPSREQRPDIADRPQPRSGEPEPGQHDASWSESGGFVGHLERFDARMRRHLAHAGGSVEEFFTGNRTIDRNYRDPDENLVEQPQDR
jgi:hypothetical protein